MTLTAWSATMAERERMSSVDTAWLRMDRPHNLMTIVGVMIFADRLELARLKHVIQSRFLRYRRFRQRVVQEGTGADWETDSDFDLDCHVRRVVLPGAAGKAELEALTGELVSTPLDPRRPLWQFTLVERYLGGSALIVRIHHCHADGIALNGVLLTLTDPSRSERRLPPVPADAGEATPQDTLAHLLRPIGKVTGVAAKVSGMIWGHYLNLLTNPMHGYELAGKGYGLVADAGELAFMSKDAPTTLKGEPGLTKSVVWSDALMLPDVKQVGKSLGCTINDVLISAVTGSLRAYLAANGDPVGDLTIRAVVPVNLRPPEDDGKLGNQFGMVFLDLPVGIENPLARLYEVSRRMQELRHSSQPQLTLALLEAVGSSPNAVEQVVLNILSANASMVITNVPGPREPIYMGGARLSEQVFWVPQAGDIGLGISILSYAGRVQFGVVADKKLIPDPRPIVDRFAAEFERLLMVSLMEPWGERVDPEQFEAKLNKWLSERRRLAA
jgi:WS/DGAT/MGAT family acyltransferase